MTLTLNYISHMDQATKKFFMVIVLVMAGGLVHLPLKAQNSLLRYAEKQYELENYSHAASLYVEAYERRARYSTALMAANTYQNMQDYQNAFNWWKTVVGHEESTKNDYSNYLKSAIRWMRTSIYRNYLQVAILNSIS